MEGVVNPSAYLLETAVEFITRDGTLQRIEYGDVKALCFISESGKLNLFSDANLFERRPKIPGLWVRFIFRDGDQLDGVLPHNLVDWPNAGYLIVPPRASGARQRVFLPRAAISGTELRGIVGRVTAAPSPLKKPSQNSEDGQLSMFDLNTALGSR